MAGHKKHHEEEEAGEAWLLPYSDLMTLLLAVFIVLFAVSQVDQAKADAMAGAFGTMLTVTGGMGDKTGVGDGSFSIPPITEASGVDDDPGAAEKSDLEALQKKLDEYFAEAGLSTDVTTSIDERGLVVSLSSTVLFDSGKAVILPEHRDLLIKTGLTLKNIDNYIRIEGHTDNVPISSAAFPSNFELSAARAMVLTHLFIDHCDIKPEKIITVGYSEYRPIADNSTPEGRAKNRRVDLVILSSKYNALEDMGQ